MYGEHVARRVYSPPADEPEEPRRQFEDVFDLLTGVDRQFGQAARAVQLLRDRFDLDGPRLDLEMRVDLVGCVVELGIGFVAVPARLLIRSTWNARYRENAARSGS